MQAARRPKVKGGIEEVGDGPGGAALGLGFSEKSTGGGEALSCNQVVIFSFRYYTMEWFLIC